MAMKLARFILILFLLPFLAVAQDSGCGGKENCFPDASDYFGVTSGNAERVVKDTKEGPHSGAQSAIEEMYGSDGEGGWAKKLKESELVGNPKHEWKNGRSISNTFLDYRLDSKIAIGAFLKAIDSRLKPNDVSEGFNSQAESELPGFGDGFANFHRCMEPRLISPRCPYCWPIKLRPKKYSSSDCPKRDNKGFVWEYWWPEYTIEINNFGISALNPLMWGRVDLNHTLLLWQKNIEMQLKLLDHMLDLSTRLTRVPGGIDFSKLQEMLFDSNLSGQTAFEGITAPDQTQFTEAHLYKPKVQTDTHTCGEHPWCPDDERLEMGCWGRQYIKINNRCIPLRRFWYNGYKYKNYECIDGGEPNKECFYQATPEKIKKKGKWVAGWTEERDLAPFWRIPELSQDINEDWYKVSVPIDARFGKGFLYNLAEQRRYLEQDTCASYRASRWPDIFGELAKDNVFDIKSREADFMGDICYQGGGQLYPLVGSTVRHFNSLTGAALIARRAIELLSETREDLGSDYFDPDINRYTDVSNKGAIDPPIDFFFTTIPIGKVKRPVDKLQMIYPRASKCFRMVESKDSYGTVPIVSDKYEEGSQAFSEFPQNVLDPKQKGSIRFVVWNRRTVCSCQYKSIYKNTKLDLPCFYYVTNNLKCGWGCQIYHNKKRGNGDERPKDKFYVSMPGLPLGDIISSKAIEKHAEPAWQLYPFKQW